MTNFSQVDDTYKDFSTRMDKYRAKLEAHLGIEPRLGPGADQLSLDRTSVSSVDSGVATATSRLSSTSELTSAATPGGSSSKASSAHGGSTSNLQETAEKRKSARRREFIMVIFAEFFKLKTWIYLQVKKFKKSQYKSWDPQSPALY